MSFTAVYVVGVFCWQQVTFEPPYYTSHFARTSRDHQQYTHIYGVTDTMQAKSTKSIS